MIAVKRGLDYEMIRPPVSIYVKINYKSFRSLKFTVPKKLSEIVLIIERIT